VAWGGVDWLLCQTQKLVGGGGKRTIHWGEDGRRKRTIDGVTQANAAGAGVQRKESRGGNNQKKTRERSGGANTDTRREGQTVLQISRNRMRGRKKGKGTNWGSSQ